MRILKVDKDWSLPSSYRPICLTRCVCKVLENGQIQACLGTR
jgi:hypothetical protein